MKTPRPVRVLQFERWTSTAFRVEIGRHPRTTRLTVRAGNVGLSAFFDARKVSPRQLHAIAWLTLLDSVLAIALFR